MFEARDPEQTGPTNQTQIPTYKGLGSCDRWSFHLLPHKTKDKKEFARAGRCLRPKGAEFLRWLGIGEFFLLRLLMHINYTRHFYTCKSFAGRTSQHGRSQR